MAPILQDELEELVLSALYDYAQIGSKKLPTSTVRELLQLEIGEIRVRHALESLVRRKLVDVIYNAVNGSFYEISEKGYRHAEAQSNRSLLSQFPAADRYVPLNHNAPEYSEIKAGIADLVDQIREWNGNPDNPDERSRLLHGLEAAQRLWEATQLEYMQIKVGVIMAVEAVGPRLEALGKGVGWKLVIDAIWAFLKTHAKTWFG